MSTRRHFMVSVGWSAVAAALPVGLHAKALPTYQPAAGLWVVDQRLEDLYPLASPYGAAHVRLGADVSKAWFRAIRPHLQAHRTPIAGLTQEDALFCLQQLAADFRWRLQRCVDVAQGHETSPACLVTRSNSVSWLLVPPSVA